MAQTEPPSIDFRMLVKSQIETAIRDLSMTDSFASRVLRALSDYDYIHVDSARYFVPAELVTRYDFSMTLRTRWSIPLESGSMIVLEPKMTVGSYKISLEDITSQSKPAVAAILRNTAERVVQQFVKDILDEIETKLPGTKNPLPYYGEPMKPPSKPTKYICPICGPNDPDFPEWGGKCSHGYDN